MNGTHDIFLIDQGNNMLRGFSFPSPQTYVSDVSPSILYLEGGLVTVSGFFNPKFLQYCLLESFGLISASIINNNTINCILPVNYNPGFKQLKIYEVSLYNYDYDLKEYRNLVGSLKVRYLNSSLKNNLYRISPRRGSVEGGTLVTLWGNFWTPTATLLCRFGDEIVQASFFNESVLLCVTPNALSINI